MQKYWTSGLTLLKTDASFLRSSWLSSSSVVDEFVRSTSSAVEVDFIETFVTLADVESFPALQMYVILNASSLWIYVKKLYRVRWKHQLMKIYNAFWHLQSAPRLYRISCLCLSVSTDSVILSHAISFFDCVCLCFSLSLSLSVIVWVCLIWLSLSLAFCLSVPVC